MSDKVNDDGNNLAPEHRLRREITDKLLSDLRQADMHSQGGRQALLFDLGAVGIAVQDLAALERKLGRFTGPAPDKILSQAAYAIAGLDEGTVDPMLAPAMERRRRVVDAAEDKHRGTRAGPTANVLIGRATAAAAMQLLMLADKKVSLKTAAREVAKILKDEPILADSKGEPWRVIARWRQEIMAQAEKRELPKMDSHVDFRTQAAGHFNSIVNETKRQVDAGAPPALYTRHAKDLLAYGLGTAGSRNSGMAARSRNASG